MVDRGGRGPFGDLFGIMWIARPDRTRGAVCGSCAPRQARAGMNRSGQPFGSCQPPTCADLRADLRRPARMRLDDCSGGLCA